MERDPQQEPGEEEKHHHERWPLRRKPQRDGVDEQHPEQHQRLGPRRPGAITGVVTWATAPSAETIEWAGPAAMAELPANGT